MYKACGKFATASPSFHSANVRVHVNRTAQEKQHGTGLREEQREA